MEGDQINYNEGSKQLALSEIERFDANFGGTDILSPLRSVLEDQTNQNRKARIFLLTDGQVGNPNDVIALAGQHNEKARVFSFGLGSGCDKHLVEQVAKAGRGSSTIVEDGCSELNGLVISALGNAIEPSLKDSQISWNGKVEAKKELFRNSLLYSTRLMTAEEFESVAFAFSTSASDGKESLDWRFEKQDFKLVEGDQADALFKMAVYREIQKEDSGEKRKNMSVKHQVLCDETAMIGVIK